MSKEDVGGQNSLEPLKSTCIAASHPFSGASIRQTKNSIHHSPQTWMSAASHIAARPFPVKGLSMTRIRTEMAWNSLATGRHLDIQPLSSTTSPMRHVSISVKVNCRIFMSKRILAVGTAEPALFSRSCCQPGFQLSRKRDSKTQH